MKTPLYPFLLLLTLTCVAQDKANKWIDLFDGTSLDGWTPNVADQQITVKNGTIQMLSVKSNLWLVHKDVFRNFELIAEIKAPLENYNTGIAFRCDETPIGYQCEVFERQSGSLYAIKKGWIHPPSKDQLEEFYKIAGDCYKGGKWNQFRIKCVGDRIQIWVNGHKTTDIRDSLFTEGRVSIQHHGKGEVHLFRNIKIRTLP